MKVISALSIVALIAASGGAYMYRAQVRDFVYEMNQPELPVEESISVEEPATVNPAPLEVQPATPDSKTTPTASPVPAVLPAQPTPPVAPVLKPELNLAVPFASQAPHANWDYPYQEACEETTLIMINAYLKGKKLDPDTADSEILKLVEWENKTFGYYKDTNVAEVMRMLKEYFGLENSRAVSVKDKTDFFEGIKRELSQGNLIALPIAGRLLNNPNFTAPGPLYHMLVIKGYTKNGLIITNDPGTRRGHNYTYTPDTLYNALHDWNGGDVENGAKIYITVGK